MRLSRSGPHFRARIHSRVCSAHRTSRANVQHTSRRVVSHRAQVELRDDGHAHVRTERASRRRCPKNEDFLKQGDARVRSRSRRPMPILRAQRAKALPRGRRARLLRDGRARGTRTFGRDGTHRARRATRLSPRRRVGHLRTHPYTLPGGVRRTPASSTGPAACGKALFGRARRSRIASAEKNASGERRVEYGVSCEFFLSSARKRDG